VLRTSTDPRERPFTCSFRHLTSDVAPTTDAEVCYAQPVRRLSVADPAGVRCWRIQGVRWFRTNPPKTAVCNAKFAKYSFALIQSTTL